MSDVELTTAERTGFVNVHIKDNAGVYRFRIDEADSLRRAWTNGESFFTGTGWNGTPTTIKLALVEGLTVWTPDACVWFEQNSAEERERERNRKLVEGEA